jgi:hypothetical protein
MPDASMPQDASEGSADAEAQTTDDAQVHADAAVVSAEDAALQAFDAATVSVDAGVLAPEDAAVQTADAALLALDASTSATQPMGCGCAATNRSRAGWLGLVLGLGLLRRRGRLQG